MVMREEDGRRRQDTLAAARGLPKWAPKMISKRGASYARGQGDRGDWNGSGNGVDTGAWLNQGLATDSNNAAEGGRGGQERGQERGQKGGQERAMGEPSYRGELALGNLAARENTMHPVHVHVLVCPVTESSPGQVRPNQAVANC